MRITNTDESVVTDFSSNFVKRFSDTKQLGLHSCRENLASATLLKIQLSFFDFNLGVLANQLTKSESDYFTLLFLSDAE